MSDLSEKFQKVKKRIRKIKLISQTVMENDKKGRRKLLEGLVTQYQKEKEKADSGSLTRFYLTLKEFIDVFESKAAEATKDIDSQIRIEGLHQELPKDTSPMDIVEEEKKTEKSIMEAGAEKRRWEDYKEIEDVKKGKFTDEEVDKLKHSLCQYVKVNNLGIEGLIQLCSAKTEGEIKGAWGEIARCLPNRSLQACHNLVRRKFNPYNYKGKWTEEEEDELIEYIGKIGKEWKKVAEILGRTATNIRDKWRELGGDNYLERRKDEWSIEETVKFLKLLEVSSGKKFLKANIETHVAAQLKSQAKHIVCKKKDGEISYYFEREHRLDHLKDFLDGLRAENVTIPNEGLNWTAIAHKMKTRSVDDCRNKWMKQMYFLLTSKKRFTPKHDLELAQAIHAQGVEQFSEIDFEDLGTTQAAEENRNRWIQLTKTVGCSISDSQIKVAAKVLEKLKQDNKSEEADNNAFNDQTDGSKQESIIEFYKRHYQQ